MKTFKLCVLIFVTATLMLYSCQKENSVSGINSNEKEKFALDEPPHVDSICDEEGPCVLIEPDSERGAMHAIPNSIIQLFQDPDYGDCFYFDSLYHDCSLDTTGYYFYSAPSKYFLNEYLSIAVEGDSILMYYILDFQPNTDWEYCYNHNVSVPVYANLYDGTSFFTGTYNVRQGTLNINWVNPTLFNSNSKVPRPGWGTFCEFWDYFGFISSLTFSIACPAAGVTVAIIDFVVHRTSC